MKHSLPAWYHAFLPTRNHFATLRPVALCLGLFAVGVALLIPGGVARAQCTEQGPLQNYTGGAQVICPCFIPGEQAGVVLQAPANEYPIEILTVVIAWGSQFGGSPQSLEQAIHIYQGGLPNPGAPIFTLPGPVMTDGFFNEFDIELLPGNKIIPSGPFTVTLEFANASTVFGPSTVHDGNGCQPGKNVVYTGVWNDACQLGVTGDWVMYVTYRSLKAVAAANPSSVLFTNVQNNQTTCDTVYVRNDGCDTLFVDGINGCTNPPFSLDTTMTDHSIAPGDSSGIVVCVMPTGGGADTCTVSVVSNAANGTQEIGVSLDVVTGIDAPHALNGFRIVSVSPNPFNPSTTVRFTLPEAMPVTAEIYRVDGARVRALASGRVFGPGDNVLSWDGRNDKGETVTSGVYLVRISTRLGQRVTRAVLLK